MEAALEGVLVLVFRCGSELTMGAASMTFQAARSGYLFEAVGAGKGMDSVKKWVGDDTRAHFWLGKFFHHCFPSAHTST